MIYGINFGAPPIPPAFRRMFAARLDARFRRVSGERSAVWLLVGVATDAADRDTMIETATNGARRLHVVERPTAGAPFYGIYSS